MTLNFGKRFLKIINVFQCSNLYIEIIYNLGVQGCQKNMIYIEERPVPNRTKRVPDEPCKIIIKINRSVIVNTIAAHVNYIAWPRICVQQYP